MPITLTNLFGEEEKYPNRIRIRFIEAKYHMETICEDAPEWMTTRFNSPEQVFEMFRCLQEEAKEHFIALHIDGKNRIACIDRVSIGSLNQSIVHAREVFKTALLSSAAGIILVHNHPTGDPTPSNEDKEVTKRLVEAGALLGIPVIDHIIIGNEPFSFRGFGLI